MNEHAKKQKLIMHEIWHIRHERNCIGSDVNVCSMHPWQNWMHWMTNMQPIHVMQFLGTQDTKMKIKHGMLKSTMLKQQLNMV